VEQEQQNYLNLVETIATEMTPLGKIQSEQNNEDSDAESVASDGER
jgi:Anaphase-promoting complex subunit 15